MQAKSQRGALLAGVSAQIEDKVKDCTICRDYAPAQQKEPLISCPVPDLPWEIAASELHTIEGEQYLVLVDYYFKYIEVTKLKDLTSLPLPIAPGLLEPEAYNM